MAEIKTQVEFYFSDSNYRKDTFLRAAAESDPEGFVPISVLLTFNKLRSMTSDVKAVADAIADSEQLVLNATKDKVKRAEPLPDVDTSAERTLYIKGYPTDDADVTIASITSYFSQFGKVNMVKMRKTLEKTFKGSVLVEFGTVAAMEEALKATHEYKGKPFTQVSTFADWNNEKQAFLSKRKGDKRKHDDISNDHDNAAEEEVTFEPGLVFRVTGVPVAATALQLKEYFKKISPDVKFVDLTENASAVLRVANAEAASKIAAQAGNLELELEGDETKHALGAALLTGAEESAYWAKFRDTMRGRGGDKRGNHGGRGGRGRGGKRQRR
jgi:lupus La protein